MLAQGVVDASWLALGALNQGYRTYSLFTSKEEMLTWEPLCIVEANYDIPTDVTVRNEVGVIEMWYGIIQISRLSNGTNMVIANIEEIMGTL